MGKAATNEGFKLKATYYNNLAVGLLIGGVLLPYLAMVQRLSEVRNTLHAIESGAAGIENADVQKLIFFIFTIVVAFSLAIFFRDIARSNVAKIED